MVRSGHSRIEAETIYENRKLFVTTDEQFALASRIVVAKRLSSGE